MQWRILILLASGIAVIYLASLLQDVPLPHPAKINTSDLTRFQKPPDKIVLTNAGDYLYQTAVWYKITPNDREGFSVGIGPMKTNVVGYVKQLRKPLSSLLNTNQSHEWTSVFEHQLAGPISFVSDHGIPDLESKPFGVLYYTIKQDIPRFYVRLYYLSLAQMTFEYKDLLLPGSSWINAFTLEKDSILYSRDHDQYNFRFIPIPPTIFSPPHSVEYTMNKSEVGDAVPAKHQLAGIVDRKRLLSKLYASDDTYRMMTLDVYRTKKQEEYFKAILKDRTTDTASFSSLLRLEPTIQWEKRASFIGERGYVADPMEFSGIMEVSQTMQGITQRSLSPMSFTRSKDGKTLVFHFMDAIVTLDYMTDIDVVKTYSKQREELFMKNSQYLPDYYYSNKNYFIAPNDFDADITGLRINEEGNLMAIWSAKYIYIYKRGDADHAMMDPNTVEDEEDIDEDIDKFPIPADVLARFPARWKLRMMVPLPELRSLSISSIHFYNASISDDRTPQNFMFVAFEKGSVYSYLVDDTEAPENISFWTFVTNRWDMVIAMSIVISIFVFNEYHHFS